MPSKGVGYRPDIKPDPKGPVTQSLYNNIANIEAMIADIERSDAKKEEAVDQEGVKFYTWDQMVALTHRESVSAETLDTMLRTVYDYGEQLEAKARLAQDAIASVTDPIPVDQIFVDDTADAANLIFGKPYGITGDDVIPDITPAQMDCVQKILGNRDNDTAGMEKDTVGTDGTGGAAASTRIKFKDLDTIDAVIQEVKDKVPKFNLEFLVALILITIEAILKLILKPLCPFKILFIKVGKLMVKLISIPTYYATLTMVDVRGVCSSCGDGPRHKIEEHDDAESSASGCDDGRDNTLQQQLAEDFDAIRASFLRGEFPGMGLDGKGGPEPICEDPDPDRVPNHYEIAAAARIQRAVHEKIARDTSGNDNHQNLSAYMKANLAEQKGFTIKASAGNMQDKIRLDGNKGVSKNLKLQGKSPAAQFIAPEFQKGVLLVVNQMLQGVKAVDKMIRNVTSLAFMKPRMANMICCFVRLLFGYVVNVAQKDGLTNWNTANAAAFRTFIKQMGDRQVGTDFAKEFAKTNKELKDNPGAAKFINEIVKVIKVLEALLSGLGSTISADLSFMVNADMAMLADSIIGTVGKSLTILIDVLMAEIRTPAAEFMEKLMKDPTLNASMDECDIFKLFMGFMTCGIDGVGKFLYKLIAGFQRDINEDWLQIGASITAQYNQKVINILREILNILLNDFYAFFTICNIDRMYTPDELNEASKRITESLNIKKELPTAVHKEIYTPIGAVPSAVYAAKGPVGQVNELTENNEADDFLTNTPFDFLKPDQFISDVQMQEDFATMFELLEEKERRAATPVDGDVGDELQESQYNIDKVLQGELEEVISKLAFRSACKCNPLEAILTDPDILRYKGIFDEEQPPRVAEET